MIVYSFGDRRLLDGARLYLAQNCLRSAEMSCLGLAVWFPTAPLRDAFEKFVYALGQGRCTVRVMEDNCWFSLPRGRYADREFLERCGVCCRREEADFGWRAA
jgi:hypothetical protein